MKQQVQHDELLYSVHWASSVYMWSILTKENRSWRKQRMHTTSAIMWCFRKISRMAFIDLNFWWEKFMHICSSKSIWMWSNRIYILFTLYRFAFILNKRNHNLAVAYFKIKICIKVFHANLLCYYCCCCFTDVEEQGESLK